MKSWTNRPVKMIAAAAIAMGATLAATPAAANETALGDADSEFTELFATWQIEDGERVPTSAQDAIAANPIPAGMPVEGVRMSSSYGMRDHPVLRQRRSHRGVDLAGPTGTPIYATADGVVSMARYYGSYGNYVQIEHAEQFQTRYAHMSRIAIADGAQVRRGDLIGYIGSTGRSTGPHLHYEVRIGGQAVNPIPYMVESETQLAANEAGGAGGPE